MKHLLIVAALMGAATPTHARDLHGLVTEVAKREHVPVALAHGVTAVETGYDCRKVGKAGELGPMQVKPATARSVGVHGNLRDCRTGLVAGMRYLRAALHRAGGNWTVALCKYNGGLASTRRSSGYARKVLAAL